MIRNFEHCTKSDSITTSRESNNSTGTQNRPLKDDNEKFRCFECDKFFTNFTNLCTLGSSITKIKNLLEMEPLFL